MSVSTARAPTFLNETQGADADGDCGSTGADGLGGPALGDEQSVPAQDRGRRDEHPEGGGGRVAVG
jgi:hypothetical protein